MLLPRHLYLLLLLLASASSTADGLLRRGGGAEQAVKDDENRDLLLDTRIVGGNVVNDLDKHPYFAEWNGQYCGGALIHDDLVLTAAHCSALSRVTRDMYFRTIRRKQQGVKRRVIDWAYHPNFDADDNTRDYDFLVLKLDSSPLVDEDGDETGVEAISINTDPNVPAEGDPLWGMGYGQIGEDISGMVNELRDVEIEAFSDEKCEDQYTRYFEAEYMFCGGSPNGGKDTCQGDSGGPIVDIKTNTLVGIVSFGIGCAEADHGGVNSRVSYAASWIEELKCSLSDYPPSSCGFPTTSPPTEAPTKAATTAPSATARVPGNIEFHFKMDDYPEELSYTVLSESQESTLVNIPFGDITVQGMQVNRSFDDLEPGSYYVKMTDLAGDGLCCDYGVGEFWITDENKDGSNEIYRSDGRYGMYLELDIEIRNSGFASVTRTSPNYQPGSWQYYEEETMTPSNESAFPGAMPSQNESTIVVNIELDDYPEETSYVIERKTPNGTWFELDSWSNESGDEAGMGELVSFEYDGMNSGWHRFAIRDAANDGICCEYGRGWYSLTGPLFSKNGEKGLIYGSRGEFYTNEEVFFRINRDGFITEISWTAADA